MTIAWINPAALIVLGLVALPIAIHLLVRQPTRSIAYPSLRFLRETELAAFRRRTIQDRALLGCRIAIVVAAALAVAGPVFQTPGRTAAYANRVSRAIVVVGSVGNDSIGTLTAGAFRAATFSRAALGDALSDALLWLERQPPSAREIVVTGGLRRGVVHSSDLLVVPEGVGIRFVPAPFDAAADVTLPFLIRRNRMLVRVNRTLHLSSGATSVTDAPGTPVPADRLAIVAAAPDQPLAEAALRAALDAGVPWSDVDRRALVVWEGAGETAVTRAPADALIVRMARPFPPSASADAVLAALTRAGVSSRPVLEPMPIPPEQLSEWSRRPGPARADGVLADKGDRRWLWGAALVLLVLEWWLRSRKSRTAVASLDEGTEARVA